MRATMIRTIGLLALLAGTALQASAAAELLRPEQAFPYMVEADANAVTLRFDIVEGHYLYRSRFGFESRTPGIELGDPELPPGKMKEDPYFGLQALYRGDQVIRIPYTRSPGAPQRLEIEMRLQGCSDEPAICYPPQRWPVEVTLPTSAGGLLDRVRDLTGGTAPLLDPADAFRTDARVVEGDMLEVIVDVAPGYYLYRHSLAVRALDDGVQAGLARTPMGEPKTDEYFGDTEVYYGQMLMRVPLAIGEDAPDSLRFELDLQGCAEDRLCYNPETRILEVPRAAASAATGDERLRPVGELSEQGRIAALVADGDLALIAITFLGFGLLLTFTPCVLPMIPILSGIIAGRREEMDARRGFLLSFSYAQGVAVTYAILGIVAGLAGANLQIALQAPPVLIVTAGIFVLLALSMFGFYELQVPAFIRDRLDRISQRQEGGGLVGVFIMGLISALIVSPCVAPPLAGAVLTIASTGDWVTGGLALYAMGLGMGVPLMIVGVTEGRLLPNAGAWMDAVKAAFGVLLLAVALWLLARLLPGQINLAAWGLLALGSGVYMGAFDGLQAGVSGWRRLWKTVGIALAVYGVVAIGGALAGGSDPTRPLSGLTSGSGTAHEALPFQRVKTVDQLEAAVAAAARQGRPVMFDFYADWCVSCIEMERFTFPEAEVREALGDTVWLQADVTANDDEDKALLERFGILGPPTIVFFDRDGRQIEAARVVGFLPADEFAAHVRHHLNRD